MQFVGDVVNAAYPYMQSPDPFIAGIGNAAVESYEAGKYVTVHLQIADPRGIANWIDSYFQQVLDAESDYAVDVSLQWL